MNRADHLEKFAARLTRQIASSASSRSLSPALAPKESNTVDHSISRTSPLSDFNETALELFELQFELNLAYRRVCETRGCSPDKIQSWQDIPAVPTVAFKELELSCIPAGERTTVFFSSGTTQARPSRHFHSPASLKVYEQSLVTGFECQFGNGIRSHRVLALTPDAIEAPHSSLVHMFETLRQELEFARFEFAGQVDSTGAWTVNQARSVETFREATAINQSVLLLGTAFSYVYLLDFLSEQNLQLQLPVGSLALETGGYKGRTRTLPKAELHSLISQKLGISPSNIIGEYGMSELSSQGYDHFVEAKKARYFRFPAWARVKIISPETGLEVPDGEAGLIRIFDLANVYSVLAVQTEDLGISHEGGFELLGRSASAEPRGCSLMNTASIL